MGFIVQYMTAYRRCPYPYRHQQYPSQAISLFRWYHHFRFEFLNHYSQDRWLCACGQPISELALASTNEIFSEQVCTVRRCRGLGRYKKAAYPTGTIRYHPVLGVGCVGLGLLGRESTTEVKV